jgi:hypothetical protein
MTNRTLSIEIPNAARIPEGLGQGALEYLFMDLLRSRGWIDSADVECLAGERAQEFEQQLGAAQGKTCWSSRFVEELTAARSDDEGRQAIEEMVAVIAANRTRKAPPVL